MPTIQEILNDPEFHLADHESKRAVLSKFDPEFAMAPRQMQDSILWQTRPGIMGTLSRGFEAVRGALTSAVAGGIEGMAKLDPGTSLGPYGKIGPSPKQMGEEIASVAVPQTPRDAAIMAGTMGAGMAARAASPLVAAGSRVLGAAAGGGVGAAFEGAAPMEGVQQGAAGAGLGEAVGMGVNLALRAGPGSRRLQNRGDARTLNQWLGDTVPALKGAKTIEELRDLVKSTKGRDSISDEFDRLIGPHLNQPVSVPSLGNPANPLGVMSLGDAHTQLKNIGHAGFGGQKADPLNRTIVGKDARQLWQQGWDEIERSLPSAIVENLREGRTQYSRGMTMLQILRRVWRGTPDGPELNMPKLQDAISDKQSLLEKRLTRSQFESLIAGVYRGAGIGSRDSMAQGSGRVMDAMRFAKGAGAFTKLPITTILPNVESSYAGRAPVQISPLGRTLLDLGGETGISNLR